jgi:molybdate ABC transporter permease protein
LNLFAFLPHTCNLADLFNNSISSPVLISLKTAITATLITFWLGVAAAWWITNYHGKAKGLIDGILTAPLVLPPTVVGFLLLLALGKNGLIGKLLDLMGIRVIFTWYATVIAAVVVSFPLMYKITLAAFQQSNNANLIACGRTLGASETTIFWRIILPLAKPGLIAGTLLAFARALGEFGATLILAGSIPGKTETIPIAIFFAAESGAMDRALILVIILLCISIGVIVGANYWQDQDKFTRRTKSKTSLVGYSQERLPFAGDIQLEVDLQKQLPEFLLDIKFKINHQRSPLGILGSSGAGKSTLLKCIAGLETPDQGRIVLNNQVLFDSAQGINLPPQKRAVGLLFQNYALFPHLSVGENIAFGMSNQASASKVKQEINKQLQQVNLAHLGKAMTEQLSGGEQQRVALARVFASQPNLTLLDEPFSALDINLQAKLIQLLQQRINNYDGLTLYVTHNLSQAYQLCDQLLIIDRGKAIAFATKQELINYPPNRQTAQIMGYTNFSPAQKIAPHILQALDWGCNLISDRLLPEDLNYIAIPFQAIIFVLSDRGINIYPAWLSNHIELPNRITLYLKLYSSPNHLQDYHLETEVTLNQWQQLQQQTSPYYVQLLPHQIIMFKT